MFKPTQALCRRYRKLRLTTKDINKGYYKGTRTGRMGTHDKWGGYKIDYSLVRTYAVPKDLDDFPLTPFVSKRVQQKSGMESYKQYGEQGPRSPLLYLDQWKETVAREKLVKGKWKTILKKESAKETQAV